MHPKNTTSEIPNQHSPTSTGSCQPCGGLAAIFTQDQRAVVVGLLIAERNHASRWWTYLSEMRLHGQLPDWVVDQEVGRHVDYDRWSLQCQATNRELLGFEGHLNSYGSSDLAVTDLEEYAPQKPTSPVRGAGGAAC